MVYAYMGGNIVFLMHFQEEKKVFDDMVLFEMCVCLHPCYLEKQCICVSVCCLEKQCVCVYLCYLEKQCVCICGIWEKQCGLIGFALVSVCQRL